MASVRFICGTQEEHKQLEARISSFLGMEDTILYSSCFDANGGLFETLLGEEDAIISDALNHASIIDGVRLSKAKRFRYANNDMAALEEELKKAEGSRFKMIATDGVFSMDGIIANLQGVCDLAEKYGAMVMVDDSHAVGFVGKHGRGSAEHCGVEGRVDIITGTLGKALGGASGGYTSAKAEVVDWLRQRSRPYLFSNTLAPVIAAASLKVFDLIDNGDGLRERLLPTPTLFRAEMTQARLHAGRRGASDHPGDARRRERWPRRWRRGCWKRASMSSVSPSRSCRRARPASARRCRRRTARPMSTARSRVRGGRQGLGWFDGWFEARDFGIIEIGQEFLDVKHDEGAR